MLKVHAKFILSIITRVHSVNGPALHKQLLFKSQNNALNMNLTTR